MSFTTLAKVKEELGIPVVDTTHDARLGTLVGAVNGYLLGLFFLTDSAPTSYTNTHDVSEQTDGIWLVQYPVALSVGVTEVKLNGSVVAPDQYYLGRPKEMGLLCFMSQLPCGRQHVEVTHTAGWDAADPNLLALCGGATSMAVNRFNTGGSKLGIDSEKIGQYSYKMGAGASGGSGTPGGSGSGLLTPEMSLILGGLLRPFVPGD